MDYLTRDSLIRTLRDAIQERGVSQGEIAISMSKSTRLSVHRPNVSAALTDRTGRYDYLREAMAEHLLGGSWSREIVFYSQD